jgi:hypothetical protein
MCKRWSAGDSGNTATPVALSCARCSAVWPNNDSHTIAFQACQESEKSPLWSAPIMWADPETRRAGETIFARYPASPPVGVDTSEVRGRCPQDVEFQEFAPDRGGASRRDECRGSFDRRRTREGHQRRHKIAPRRIQKKQPRISRISQKSICGIREIRGPHEKTFELIQNSCHIAWVDLESQSYVW